MSEDRTTGVVQRYLDELDGESPAEPIIRALLDRGSGDCTCCTRPCCTGATRA